MQVVTQKAARKQTVVRAVAQQDDGAIQSRRAALALAAAAVIGFGAAESAQANGAAKNLSRELVENNMSFSENGDDVNSNQLCSLPP